MSELKEFLLTYACFALSIGFCIATAFFEKPISIILAICALVCMFRVVADAFLQELSWKIIVFRLTSTIGIVAELAFLYGWTKVQFVLDCLVCIGLMVSFVNFIIYLNSIKAEVDWHE